MIFPRMKKDFIFTLFEEELAQKGVHKKRPLKIIEP